MVEAPKIYTKTGDDGTCALASGERVKKHALRIECYGTVDELNSHVGLLRVLLIELPSEERERIGNWLEALQHSLFVLGGDLATPLEQRWENLPIVDEEDVRILEKLIDFCHNELPPLRQFILPSGSLLCAHCHVVRTITRRAERLVARLSEEELINPNILPFLNRLSDFFFMLARFIAHVQNIPHTTWNTQHTLKSLKL